MSSLAAILHYRGAKISGSDITESDQTRMLEKLGIKVYIPHNRRNIKSADFIIINSAISKRNPEFLEAKKRGIRILQREQVLALIEKNFATRIAVAGTHGKSTTTAMIYAILAEAGLEPTVHNGAVMYKKTNGTHDKEPTNFILGSDKYFLTEACEFKRNFLALNPTIAVVTNVDADHLDCYKDIDDIKETFGKFAAKASVLVKNPNCKNSSGLSGREKTLNFADIDIKLQIPGAHNIENAKAAAAVGQVLGISEAVINKALFEFKGIGRRFEKIKVIENCDIIADYAHHPTEIKTTIQTADSLYKRFLVLFQPHTYTRTLALFDSFVEVLGGCNSVLFKTYAAREKPISGGTARDLASAIGCKYLPTGRALQKFINGSAQNYDAIILTGAGDMLKYLS